MFICYNINMSNREAILIKRIKIIKQLKSIGYELDRNNKHGVYEAEGKPIITVPNHKEINENTAKAILKAAGLI